MVFFPVACDCFPPAEYEAFLVLAVALAVALAASTVLEALEGLEALEALAEGASEESIEVGSAPESPGPPVWEEEGSTLTLMTVSAPDVLERDVCEDEDSDFVSVESDDFEEDDDDSDSEVDFEDE